MMSRSTEVTPKKMGNQNQIEKPTSTTRPKKRVPAGRAGVIFQGKQDIFHPKPADCSVLQNNHVNDLKDSHNKANTGHSSVIFCARQG